MDIHLLIVSESFIIQTSRCLGRLKKKDSHTMTDSLPRFIQCINAVCSTYRAVVSFPNIVFFFIQIWS